MANLVASRLPGGSRGGGGFGGPGRYRDDAGAGRGRGGSTSAFGSNVPHGGRGGFGHEQRNSIGGEGDIASSQLPGSPHSSRGFRRALMRSQRQEGGVGGGGRLSNLVSGSNFGGRGFRKPNYFAQGGSRRGLHIGAGAPVTLPADQEGVGFGG